jgi:MFS family permease
VCPRRKVGGTLSALTIGLLLTVSMAAFEALAIATILPETVREIGGLEWYGWAFTGFMLANLVGIPLAGQAADRRGPALPFVAGVLLFASGLAVAGFATSMEMLVAGRVLQGGGAAALSSVAYVAVARAYAPEAQPRMMALLSSAWVLPGLFGPAIAAGIARQAGWRFVFLGLAPVTLFAGALALRGLRGLGAAPEAAAPPTSTSVRDALLLATGVALTLLGSRHALPLVAIGLALAGAALALFALLRLLPPGTLRARAGLPAAIAVLALVNFAFFAVEAFLPLALTDVRDGGIAWVAAALTAGTLAWTAGSWIQVRAAKRTTRRRLLGGGVVCLLAGAAGATAILSSAVPLAASVLAWAVAGLGIGIAYPVATIAILEAAPAGREGEVSSTMQIANALAIALGTGLGGDLVGRVARDGASPALGIGLVDVAAIAACALAWVAVRRVAEPKAAAR